jgi:hypothetical protein
MPALYIVLEHEIPGFDTYVNGHTLSRMERQLATVAERCAVQPLMEFFSTNAAEVADLLGVEETGDLEIPEEQWYPPAEGLRTVQALLREVENSPEIADAKADLLEFEGVLQQAQEKGIRWHLAVDA